MVASKMNGNELDLNIRAATEADVPLLLQFIRAMAAFEKLQVPATEDDLRESLFGAEPAAVPLLAFVGDQPAAYAVYFFSYSTMRGKRGLWLDDVFVDPAFRGQGVGEAIMAYLANVALQKGCARFEWMVLDWNQPAINLYKKLGATFLETWLPCRLAGDELVKLAQRNPLSIRREGKTPNDNA
jgi:GNAT superfamily N-acetyltransferase